ncbi:hypothetical protein BS47DRAFT_1381831 [Hydnum rufescens UP504]|uniref:4-coumarate-CoA ligase n=1 Tax=Hydnum rufescens UP504 TaxID=1448309 RepID=A0A9P6AZX5_9AGAM|nr:hypothetical protein BS47DRAFT_1381831 [Hydnum rufescens UP504]
MPQRIIYDSSLPPVPIKSSSIFTYAFSDKASLDHTPAYIDAASGTRISRLETYELSLQLAYAVRQRGQARGEVAMIFRRASPSLPYSYRLLAAGLRITLANSSYTPPELVHQLKDSSAGIIFVHPALFPVLLNAFKLLGVSDRDARRRVIIMSYVDQDRADEKAAKIGPEWTRLREFFGKGRLQSEELFVGDQVHETAFLCYSSGTTGLSKAWRLVMVLLWDFVTKVPQVIMPRFEPNFFAQALEKYKVTRACIVPPILVVMSFHPAFATHDIRALKMMTSGAAPLGDSLVKKVLARFAEVGNTQIRLTQGYGLTETSPTTHWLPLEDTIRKMGTIGLLLPNLQARLVDDDENDIKPGPENRGELWIRGPSVMKGYLNNPKATKNSITPDRWFKTGDIAVVDDEGFFSIVDRKKELIKYKGFQVPPADLEAVLLSNEDILDAAVIGVDSVSEATELPRAYIVPRNGELLKDSEAAAAFGKEIQEWIKTKVAHHKFLRGGVIVLDVIPKSASGKILRRTLRDLAAKEASQGTAKSRL